MKTFIVPEIEIRELSPCQTVMDDITVSANPAFGNEAIVGDPAAGSDEAVW